jgi:hypothetical protein
MGLFIYRIMIINEDTTNLKREKKKIKLSWSKREKRRQEKAGPITITDPRSSLKSSTI